MAVVAEIGHCRIHDDYMVTDPEKVDAIIKRASRIIAEGLRKNHEKNACLQQAAGTQTITNRK